MGDFDRQLKKLDLTAMTKEQLIEKVGKNGFLSDDKTLAAKLIYVSGINSFDEYFDTEGLLGTDAVIHLTKHPKGLAIKIAKNFSSFPFGLAFTEIKRTVVSETSDSSHLIFETIDGKIIFSIKSAKKSEVKQFLEDIHHKYESDKVKVENKQSQIVIEVDRNRVPAYGAKKIIIRLVVFILLYFPLFAVKYIVFGNQSNFLVPTIVLISFLASKPIARHVVSKFFPGLNE